MANARGKTAELPLVWLADDRLERGPWVYGRRVGDVARETEPGDLVEVHDASDRFVGHALWNGWSDVRLRWLSRGKRSDLDRPREFLTRRLAAADRLRRRTLRLEAVTDAYRIVHGEGDDLPGLVIDRLGPVLVVEYHALGWFRMREDLLAALGQLHPDRPVVERIAPSAVRSEGFGDRDLASLPPPPEQPVWVHEYDVAFLATPGTGHKTGFFCDQRDNRRKIAELAKDRNVLDLCCNSGGFSIHAAARGARRVTGVDLDEVVLDRARASAAENKLAIDFVHADAFPFLRGELAEGSAFDLVIADPSKLASGRARVEEALIKYTDLNALAIQAVRPGGLLATFSCSGAVDLPAFLGTVFAASRRAGRELKLLEILGAGPDHPQRPDFPRSRYLKGAICAVDG